MASHNELGRIGEAMAKTFLEERAFNILHLNWKHSYYEIDIIASKTGILHFIEVKTRRSQRFGLPEESVDQKKLEKMMNAADEFLYQFPGWERIQYDILSISVGNNDIPDFFFIEDVYL
ncbi:MAG: YraN family protein [Chitinophagaceae bacterium]